MISRLKSLQAFFSKKELAELSKKWIDSYSSIQDADVLSTSFKKTFGMSATFFGVEDDIKATMNELAATYYHNEAFIKSSFIKKELLKGNHVTLYEFPVGSSRTDLCRVNGHSYAYEIKTRFDTLDRLNKQLSDYLLAFEYVYVVCSLEKENEVLAIIPQEVGLFVYDDKKKNPVFIQKKEASFSPFINSSIQLSTLPYSARRELEKNKGSERYQSLVDLAFKEQIKKHYRANWDYLKGNMKNIEPLDWQRSFKHMAYVSL